MSSVVLQPPLNAIVPTVSLSMPSRIGPCDDMVIDASASAGSMMLPWLSIQWEISSQNAPNVANISKFLNSYCSDISSPVTIPSGLLPKSFLYTISLQLTNAYSKSAIWTRTFFVLSMADSQMPQVQRCTWYDIQIFY